jgi:N-acetylmuramoyl-L-alanine amidase
MAALVAQRADVQALITEEASRFGVPVALALAVAWQESGWRQNVVSSAGAVGIMQLMPGTAVWVGEAMLGEHVQINDARHNVRAGVRLLAHYVARYSGDRDFILSAYYQGQGATERHGIYPVSWTYIASVKRLEALFGG